jgi:hypothetical protein
MVWRHGQVKLYLLKQLLELKDHQSSSRRSKLKGRKKNPVKTAYETVRTTREVEFYI